MQGLGFRLKGFGFRVQVGILCSASGLDLRVSGLGF